MKSGNNLKVYQEGKLWYVKKIYFFKHLFIIERQRDTECEQGRAEREGDTHTQNPKQAPGSELSAQSWTRGCATTTGA